MIRFCLHQDLILGELRLLYARFSPLLAVISATPFSSVSGRLCTTTHARASRWGRGMTTTTTTTTTTTATAGLAAPPPRARLVCRRLERRGFQTRTQTVTKKRGTMVVRVHASSSSSSSSGTEEEEEEEERVVALKAARDDAALGCSSCYFPREKDRANDIAFRSESALQRTPRFGTALVVGAETGEVAERLLGAEEDGGGGAKWATVADVSPKQLDRAQRESSRCCISGNEKGAKYVELSE